MNDSFIILPWPALDPSAGSTRSCRRRHGSSPTRAAERLRGLVLASFPAAASSGHGLAAIASRFADAIDAHGLEVAGAEFVWGPQSGLDARSAALVRQGFLEHSPAALAHMLRGVLDRLPTLEGWAPRIVGLAVPTCIVSGGADVGSLAAGRWLAEIIPPAATPSSRATSAL